MFKFSGGGSLLVSMTLLLAGCGPWPNEVVEGIDFVSCPPGTFTMGHAPGEVDGQAIELPQHAVTFANGFYVGKYEVTEAQRVAVMGSIWEKALLWICPEDMEVLPAHDLSWNDAQQFVTRLNALRPGMNYRLPSEAEWEYACRAGTTARYYWGEDPDRSMMPNYAWFEGNSGGDFHPVGTKLANAWGIYDMAGNQWEWVQDSMHADYTGAPTDGSAWMDSGTDAHVVRGGSHFNATGCRSAARGAMPADRRYGDYGFRIVMTPNVK